jgi:hypothetical protein
MFSRDLLPRWRRRRKIAGSAKMSIDVYYIIRHHISGDSTLYGHCPEKPEANKMYSLFKSNVP